MTVLSSMVPSPSGTAFSLEQVRVDDLERDLPVQQLIVGEEYDPEVPVWCITPNEGGTIHRFFDTCPISPSGRYVALFRLPREDRQPEPGEAGQVVLVDLESGDERVVGETCGWEPQMGANINWGASDHALFFNDVDATTWQPFAWKLNPQTGERQRVSGTVYHASPDGRWLISANMTTMRRTQPGYGVCIPLDEMRRNVGPVDDDGFTLKYEDKSGSHEVRSRFVIAADGAGSRIRKALDIEMDGPPSIQSFLMIHFAANLREMVRDRPGVLPREDLFNSGGGRQRWTAGGGVFPDSAYQPR